MHIQTENMEGWLDEDGAGAGEHLHHVQEKEEEEEREEKPCTTVETEGGSRDLAERC